MNIFAIPMVRVKIRQDIDAIGTLTNQEISHLNELKAQLASLQQEIRDYEEFDINFIRQCKGEVQEAQTAVTLLNTHPEPQIPPRPTPISIEFPEHKTFHSTAELDQWANFFPGRISRGFAILERERIFKSVQEYMQKKAVYDVATAKLAQYENGRANATLRLTQAQANERSAQTLMADHVRGFSQRIIETREAIKQSTRKITTLINAETLLRNRLIDTRPSTSIEVYDRVFRDLTAQLADTDVFQQISTSRTTLQERQQELLATSKRWPQFQLNNSIILPMMVLGLAVCYYDSENFDLRKFIGISLILFAAYKLSQPIQEGLSDAMNQIRGINRIAENFAFRMDQFLTNLEDMTDLTSNAAILFMNDMRAQTATMITSADHHFANGINEIGFFRNGAMRAAGEFGAHVHEVGEAVGRGIREAGEAIAARIPTCTIL